MSTTATVPPVKKPGFFGTVALDVIKIEHSAKSFFEKAAAEEPEIAAQVDKYGAEIGDVLGAVGFPQAEAVEAVVVQILNQFGQAVDDAGPAAAANGVNAKFDQKLVADFKAILPTIEGLSAKKQAAATPAK